MKEDRVCDYMTASGSWDWGKFHIYLPPSVLQEIERMDLNVRSGTPDKPIWRLTHGGEFSVRSAYSMFRVYQHSPYQSLWRKIWKNNVPQRCKMFMWVAARGKLLTNMLRMSRGLTMSSDCYCCTGVREDVIHVLRDCKVAKQCWDKILHGQRCNRFYAETDVRMWLAWNLGCRREIDGVKWPVWFALLCHQLWLNRNSGIFKSKTAGARQILEQVRAQTRWSSIELQKEGLRGIRRDSWKPPIEGWVKLNVDGASGTGGTVAGCGGLVRDQEGTVLGGFMFGIGRGSCLLAELWAILIGLKRAWDMRCSRVILESDCWEAIQLIEDGWDEEHRHANLLLEVRHLLNRDWEVAIEWCCREANSAADMLAKESMNRGLGVIQFTRPPDFLVEYLCIEETI